MFSFLSFTRCLLPAWHQLFLFPLFFLYIINYLFRFRRRSITKSRDVVRCIRAWSIDTHVRVPISSFPHESENYSSDEQNVLRRVTIEAPSEAFHRSRRGNGRIRRSSRIKRERKMEEWEGNDVEGKKREESKRNERTNRSIRARRFSLRRLVESATESWYLFVDSMFDRRISRWKTLEVRRLIVVVFSPL